MFWRSKFKEIIARIKQYDIGGLSFGCFGLVGSLQTDRRFDEIACYWLENGQKLRKNPEQAALQTLTDFSKWYLSEYASHKSAVHTYEPTEVAALEKDYVLLRKQLLHWTLMANPQLTTAECDELLPARFGHENINWAKYVRRPPASKVQEPDEVP